VLECPRCGAPLPRRAALVRVTCEFCKSEVVFDRIAVKASEYRRTLKSYRDEPKADVTLAGFGLRLVGRVAVGHSSDVFLARRVTRLGERLILKVLRSEADEPLAQNEQVVLEKLANSHARGTELFATLVPARAFSGKLEGGGFRSGFAAAFRQPTGFTHDLVELRRAFPGGVDPRHAVWLWRRALELLDWVHRSGLAHGAILPAHLLLDAREHSVRLVGWSCAGELGSPLSAIDPAELAFYPSAAATTPALSANADLTMLARCMLHALGGDPSSAPAGVPTALAELLLQYAAGQGTSGALELNQQVSDVARQCFGAPKFVKLEL
jgi:hypothetical protein